MEINQRDREEEALKSSTNGNPSKGDGRRGRGRWKNGRRNSHQKHEEGEPRGRGNHKVEKDDMVAKQSPKLNVLDVTSMAISCLNVELIWVEVMVHNPIMPKKVKKIRRFLS